MQVGNLLHAARWKHRTQKSRQKSPSGHHRTTFSGYIFATKAHIDNRKKLVKQQYVLHMVNFGPLTAEIDSGVWGTPANFNGVCIFASLLQRRRSTEANQTLHDVWPSPGWYTIYTFWGHLALLRNFARCKIHFASKSCAVSYTHLTLPTILRV